MKNYFTLFILLSVIGINCVLTFQNANQQTAQSDGENFNYIVNVTPFLSQQVGTTLNFEYYNGYIPVGTAQEESQGIQSLWFSMITKYGETLDNTPIETPVIYWFNGGPGCSSQFGNWNEIGPIKVDGETLHLNEYSWNKQALLIFVDQPLGAGLSYTNNPNINISSTSDAAPYLIRFLQAFYQTYPTLLSNPTYFFGESYAGHYIPYYASQVLVDSTLSKQLNFKGVGIGDGWVNPKAQMGPLSDFYFNIAIASQGSREEIQYSVQQAQRDIDDKNYSAATNIYDSLTDDTSAYGNVDEYNFFYYKYPGQEDPNTGNDFVNLLNWPYFRNGYGIYPTALPSFSDCNHSIYNNFSNDFTKSYQSYVEILLSKNVQVLLYSGQLDIIANGAGSQEWINTITWDSIRDWKNASKKVWYYPNSSTAVIGNYQAYSNFCYANIYLAGHMVPSDQPYGAYQMLDKYLNWSW